MVHTSVVMVILPADAPGQSLTIVFSLPADGVRTAHNRMVGLSADACWQSVVVLFSVPADGGDFVS